MVEDGGEERDASQAVEEVTEGQVQEEQGGRAPQPGEVCPVPAGVYCTGGQSCRNIRLVQPLI